MATTNESTEMVGQSTSDFLRDIDKIKSLEAVDRAALAAAFERQAKRLIDEEVRPQIELALRGIFPNFNRNPPPQSIDASSGMGDNDNMIPKIEALEADMRDVRDRLVRVETKLDAKADKTDVTKMEVRLILLGAGAWVSLLYVLAKGFHWL